MTKVLLQRLALSLAAVLLASFLIYGATEALPGDYATATLGQQATRENVAQLRHDAGLDRPFLVRYGDWLGDAAQGDLGRSYSTRQPVWDQIAPNLSNSLALAVVAMLFTIPISILLGIVSGLRQGGWFDGIVGTVTLIAVSMPEFVLGLILAAVFGVVWHLLPAASLYAEGASTWEHLRELILPASAAAGVTIGYITRMTRVATIDVLDSEYVHAARLRGVTERALVLRHVTRNALIPAVNVIGNNVAWMLGGMIAVELVFSFPGIGSLLVNAVTIRDANLIAGLALIITAVYIGVNLISDIVALLLNPRLRAPRI